MPSLLSKSSLVPGQFSLKPGVNIVGRAADNALVLNHPSVSGRHAEIIVEGESILVRDLGSTNGTFIDRQPIEESFLRPGQTLNFGAMELLCIGTDQPLPAGPVTTSLRVSKNESAVVTESVAEGPTSVMATPAIPQRMPPRPPVVPPYVYRTFYQRLPGAFAYPFKGDGAILLGGGTIVVIVLNFSALVLSFFGPLLFWLLLMVALTAIGYLAAYMQNIIASSARGEAELPDLPELSEWRQNILHPAFLLAGTFGVAFGPVLAVGFFAPIDPNLKVMVLIALAIFGCLYLPMALIGVSIYESIMALNPLLIVPSVIKIPVPYLVACVLLVLLLAAGAGITALIKMVHLPLLPIIISGFTSLYFVTVEMRILGILYHDKKDELNWVF